MDICIGGDSDFVVPDLYGLLEQNGCSYAKRLKGNNTLYKEASHLTDELNDLTALSKVDYAIYYGKFNYQARSWDYLRRMVVKVEKPTGQMTYMYTLIVTHMNLKPEEIIKFYCNHGRRENFIKESKNGFAFVSLSSSSMLLNSNRLHISCCPIIFPTSLGILP